MSDYSLPLGERLAIARNRLADIEAQILLGDDLSVWTSERLHQLRLLADLERTAR